MGNHVSETENLRVSAVGGARRDDYFNFGPVECESLSGFSKRPVE